MQAVVKRSDSRNCGKMSALAVTNAPGISSATICAARRSWAGLMEEERKQTATASTPSSRSSRATRRALRLGGSRTHVVHLHRSGVRVVQDEVRERATDVDAHHVHGVGF